MVAWLATRRGDGVLSFLTAAWVQELATPSPLPHVTVRPGASPRCPVARIHRGVVPLQDRVRRYGMVLTTPSRTIVDLAAVVARPALDEIIDLAFCRKLATTESVERCIVRMGRAPVGAQSARAATAIWTPTIEPGSVAEIRLLRILDDLGLQGLATQYDVHGPSGFVARLDLAAPHLRRGLEYDGVLHHNPRHWERDEPRYAALKALGWVIDTVTKADLLPGETRLRDIVGRWLGARQTFQRA